MCILGAINELYEALCNVRMYVCMCLKVSVNRGLPVRLFDFCHKIEWVHMVLRILNLEGRQNCMIGLKGITILSPVFQKLQT